MDHVEWVQLLVLNEVPPRIHSNDSIDFGRCMELQIEHELNRNLHSSYTAVVNNGSSCENVHHVMYYHPNQA